MENEFKKSFSYSFRSSDVGVRGSETFIFHSIFLFRCFRLTLYIFIVSALGAGESPHFLARPHFLFACSHLHKDMYPKMHHNDDSTDVTCKTYLLNVRLNVECVFPVQVAVKMPL